MRYSDLTAVVLAAGKGTRLEPISLRHSKAMAPVLGVPIVARVMEGYRRLGVRRFVVVRSPNDGDIGELCAQLAVNGVSLETAIQAERLGTAHALLQARDLIETDFVLCSCDNLFSEAHLKALMDEHISHRPPAVITLEPVMTEKLDKSAGVRLDGADIVEIVEKPGTADPGRWDALAKFLFTFDRRLLDYLDRIAPSPRGELEIQSALSMLMADSDGPPRGIFSSACLHLTSAKDLVEIHRHYLAEHRPYSIHPEAIIDDGARIVEPVMIEAGAVVRSGVTIGPNAYVGPGASLGAGCRVENSVVYPCATVGRGEFLSWEIRLPE